MECLPASIGQTHDQSTGLMHYNARYYDPTIGRFISADTIVPNPADPQQLNRYSYVRNNPVRYTDPSGHCTLSSGAMAEDLSRAPCVNRNPEYDSYHSSSQDRTLDRLRAELGEYLTGPRPIMYLTDADQADLLGAEVATFGGDVCLLGHNTDGGTVSKFV